MTEQQDVAEVATITIEMPLRDGHEWARFGRLKIDLELLKMARCNPAHLLGQELWPTFVTMLESYDKHEQPSEDDDDGC